MANIQVVGPLLPVGVVSVPETNKGEDSSDLFDQCHYSGTVWEPARPSLGSPGLFSVVGVAIGGRKHIKGAIRVGFQAVWSVGDQNKREMNL